MDRKLINALNQQKASTKSNPFLLQMDVGNQHKLVASSPTQNNNKSPFFTSPINLATALQSKAKKSFETLRKLNKQNIVESILPQSKGIIKKNGLQGWQQGLKCGLDRQNNCEVKRLHAQLEEVYRVISYYEGKIKQLEDTCKNYERTIVSDGSSKVKSQTIQGLIEQQRNKNTELRAQLQQSNVQLVKIAALLKQSERSKLDQHKMNSRASLHEQRITKVGQIDDYQIKEIERKVKKERVIVKKRSLFSDKDKYRSGKGRGLQKSQYQQILEQQSEATPAYHKKGSFSSSKESYRSNIKQGWFLGDLNSRFNLIQKEVDMLKSQNDKLQVQLDRKTEEVIKLESARHELQLKLDLLQKTQANKGFKPSNVPLIFPKSMLKQIPKPIPKDQQKESRLSFGSTGKQAEDKSYRFASISERTILKLTLNVLRQDITYLSLIDTILKAWISQQQNSVLNRLGSVPYQLSSAECKQFVQEYEGIKKFVQTKQPTKDMSESEYQAKLQEEIKLILRNNISFYKNITIRRDYTLNIQLSNKFKNYEQQYQSIVRQYNDQMPYKKGAECLRNEWGLSDQQFLFLTLKSYEETGKCDFLAICTLGKYFLLD